VKGADDLLVLPEIILEGLILDADVVIMNAEVGISVPFDPALGRNGF
jgi:hypothetical protein